MTTVDGIDARPDPSPEHDWRRHALVPVDPRQHGFLRDHRVGGTALVPTVLQLDLLAGTARELLGGVAGLSLRSIDVLDAVRVTDSGPVFLRVWSRPAPATPPDGPEAWQLELRSEVGTHLRTCVQAALPEQDMDNPSGRTVGPGVRLSRTPQEVYPPMFHGPAFQVVGRFGLVDEAIVSEPAPAMPDWSLAVDGPALPTVLLELVFQSCGVWELEHTGQMMRPLSIDEVSVAVPAPHGATSVFTPVVRVEPRSPDADRPRVFDGTATDRGGRPLIVVRGYRPTELAAGHEGEL